MNQSPWDIPPPTVLEREEWLSYWRQWSRRRDRPSFRIARHPHTELLDTTLENLWRPYYPERWIVKQPVTISTEGSSITSNSFAPFPFMKVPPEIRCMIYHHAVVTNPPPSRKGMIFAGEAIVVKRRQYLNGTPPLTRTSQLIREEALPIFLSRNAFYVQVDDIQLLDLYAWMRRIDRRYLQCLQHVQVVVNPPPENRGQLHVLWLLSDTLPPPIEVDPLRWLKMEEYLTSTAKINLSYSLQSDQCRIFALAVGTGRACREEGASWEEVASDITNSFGAVARKENMTWGMSPEAPLWQLNDKKRENEMVNMDAAKAISDCHEDGGRWGTTVSKSSLQQQAGRTFKFTLGMYM